MLFCRLGKFKIEEKEAHPMTETTMTNEQQTGSTTINTRLNDLRAQGWAVAIHNDYRLGGEFKTFWLFTCSNGKWVKGEGSTDDQALEEVWRQVTTPHCSLCLQPRTGLSVSTEYGEVCSGCIAQCLAWIANNMKMGARSDETQQIPAPSKIGGVCLIAGCTKDREKSSVHCPEHRAAFGRFPVTEPAASIGWLQHLVREESSWPAIASSARYLLKVLEQARATEDDLAAVRRDRDAQRQRADMAERNFASSDRQIRILVGELLLHRSCPNPLMAGEVAVELIRELKITNDRLKAF